ncbi:MAG: hypothetical protein MJ206_01600 [Bacilli bacterium]|nr:hypothetical protein [Bacilli bacterium]
MENLYEFLNSRHSVRSYKNEPLDLNRRNIIDNLVRQLNEEHHLKFKVVYDRVFVYNRFFFSLRFKARNAILLVHDNEEEAGYYSVPLMLKLHELGLGSCYVGSAIMRPEYMLDGNRPKCILAFGEIDIQGHPHENKPLESLIYVDGPRPNNLSHIAKIAMTAPTAMNRQDFIIRAINSEISVKKTSSGPFSDFDLGIVKYYVDLARNKVKVNLEPEQLPTN